MDRKRRIAGQAARYSSRLSSPDSLQQSPVGNWLQGLLLIAVVYSLTGCVSPVGYSFRGPSIWPWRPCVRCSDCGNGCADGRCDSCGGNSCRPAKLPYPLGYCGGKDSWITTAYAKHCAKRMLRNLGMNQNPEDFRDGFVQAYVDVADGQSGAVPPIPPEKYWSAYYRSAEGKHHAYQWFEGYRAGAAAALGHQANLYGAIADSGEPFANPRDTAQPAQHSARWIVATSNSSTQTADGFNAAPGPPAATAPAASLTAQAGRGVTTGSELPFAARTHANQSGSGVMPGTMPSGQLQAREMLPAGWNSPSTQYASPSQVSPNQSFDPRSVGNRSANVQGAYPGRLPSVGSPQPIAPIQNSHSSPTPSGWELSLPSQSGAAYHSYR